MYVRLVVLTVYRFKNDVIWPDLRVSVTGSHGPVVLVDHTAECLLAPNRRGERRDDSLVMVGWPLLPGLVRTVPVLLPHVGPQHCPQMSLV